MIVQAPHSPVLQQSLLPFISKVSRRNSKSDVDASALALIDLPLIFVFIVKLIRLPPCRWRLSKFVPDRGGSVLRRSSGAIYPYCPDRRSGSVPMLPLPRLLLTAPPLAGCPAGRLRVLERGS